MKFYVQVELLPDIEASISTNFLFSKIYQKIHIMLVKMKDVNNLVPIGLGFPEYSNKGLGNILRFFSASEEILEKANIVNELQMFRDYVHFTGIRAVPSNVYKYAVYKRLQPPVLNKERLIRRYAKRHNMIIEEVAEKYKDYKPEIIVGKPYIHIYSDSTKQWFSFFVDREYPDKLEYKGFNCFGLSTDNKSTIPEIFD